MSENENPALRAGLLKTKNKMARKTEVAKKKVPSKKDQAQMERAGEQYSDILIQEKELAASKAQLREEIIDLADKFGHSSPFNENRIVMNTLNFSEVGYVQRQASKTISPEHLKEVLDPKLWKSVCSVQLDQKKLAKAVTAGKIPEPLMLKACVISRAGSKNVYMRKQDED